MFTLKCTFDYAFLLIARLPDPSEGHTWCVGAYPFNQDMKYIYQAPYSL